MTLHADEKSFDKEVLSHKGLVLVDFWAPWCGPCRVLAPVLDELAVELRDKVKVVKVDIDDNPELASAHGVRSIPTMIMFKDGQAIETRVGNLPKSKLVEWVQSS